MLVLFDRIIVQRQNRLTEGLTSWNKIPGGLIILKVNPSQWSNCMFLQATHICLTLYISVVNIQWLNPRLRHKKHLVRLRNISSTTKKHLDKVLERSCFLKYIVMLPQTQLENVQMSPYKTSFLVCSITAGSFPTSFFKNTWFCHQN